MQKIWGEVFSVYSYNCIFPVEAHSQTLLFRLQLMGLVSSGVINTESWHVCTRGSRTIVAQPAQAQRMNTEGPYASRLTKGEAGERHRQPLWEALSQQENQTVGQVSDAGENLGQGKNYSFIKSNTDWIRRYHSQYLHQVWLLYIDTFLFTVEWRSCFINTTDFAHQSVLVKSKWKKLYKAVWGSRGSCAKCKKKNETALSSLDGSLEAKNITEKVKNVWGCGVKQKQAY